MVLRSGNLLVQRDREGFGRASSSRVQDMGCDGGDKLATVCRAVEV